MHHVVDKQYKQGLRLESLFDPDETKRIKKEMAPKTARKLKPINK